MSLARLGGYGFVFVDGSKTSTVDNTEYVTMAFRNEPYDRALNSVLMSSCRGGWMKHVARGDSCFQRKALDLRCQSVPDESS